MADFVTLDLKAMATVVGGKSKVVPMKTEVVSVRRQDGSLWIGHCLEDSKVETSKPDGTKLLGMSCGFEPAPPPEQK